MVVNSISFLLFFIVVFVVYYATPIAKNVRYQNFWVLLTSYFLYGYTDLKTLPILITATIAFYLIGKWLKNAIDNDNHKLASCITTIGVCLGVGVLLYFKYFNFFAESVKDLLNAVGFHVSWSALHIILPLGVSFFTFKFISYIIEIHLKKIEPSRNFIDFAAYIAFFPTIFSGPIDRPGTFLPQLDRSRQFSYDLAMDGFRQILWGMFTKMCIADILSGSIDMVWNNLEAQNGSTILLATIFYPIQLYADFDGYSNMAIGTGKILGFHITRNFNHPFLARNIAEYWRCWHISLMTWLRDYIYFPLGGSRCSKLKNIRNIYIVWAVSGLWHGANWTFVIWGLYHGTLMALYKLLHFNTKNKDILVAGRWFPSFKDFCKMIVTSILVFIGWIIFRADTLEKAMTFMGHMFSLSLFSAPSYPIGISTLAIIFVLLALEWYQRDKEYPLQMKPTFLAKKKWLPYVLDFIIIAVIVFYGNFEGSQFIYFQF
jgi:D-alanyl-lipoteichoic acid acyltransferase DltB (MBOAT superfamily)